MKRDHHKLTMFKRADELGLVGFAQRLGFLVVADHERLDPRYGQLVRSMHKRIEALGPEARSPKPEAQTTIYGADESEMDTPFFIKTNSPALQAAMS